jgi:hypothetical protein
MKDAPIKLTRAGHRVKFSRLSAILAFSKHKKDLKPMSKTAFVGIASLLGEVNTIDTTLQLGYVRGLVAAISHPDVWVSPTDREKVLADLMHAKNRVGICKLSGKLDVSRQIDKAIDAFGTMSKEPPATTNGHDTATSGAVTPERHIPRASPRFQHR